MKLERSVMLRDVDGILMEDGFNFCIVGEQKRKELVMMTGGTGLNHRSD